MKIFFMSLILFVTISIINADPIECLGDGDCRFGEFCDEGMCRRSFAEELRYKFSSVEKSSHYQKQWPQCGGLETPGCELGCFFFIGNCICIFG